MSRRSPMKRRPTVRVESVFTGFRIYLNGTLHLHVMREGLIGMLSWIEYGRSRYIIEYYYAGGGSVTTEYDSEEKFKAVLKGLEGLL